MNEEEIKINITDISDAEIKEIIQKTTLLAFRSVTDEKNFQMLKMLPANRKTIAKELKISDYSTFRRVKILKKLGIINEENEIITTTSSGKLFIYLIESIMKQVDTYIKEEMSKGET